MFYCLPCPEPKILGTHIATIVHQQGEDKYHWDSNIESVVVVKYDGAFVLVPNANIRMTLDALYFHQGSDVLITEFKLYEHNIDRTRGNDDARFEECNWSDYSYDGLCVWARIRVVAAMDPQM